MSDKIDTGEITISCSVCKCDFTPTSWQNKNGKLYPKYRCQKCDRLSASKYSKKNLKIRLLRNMEYAKLFPEKIKARALLRRNLMSGKIIKKPCENCGNKRVHGHHPDYSKPLLVIWLCSKCHVNEHKRLAEKRRIEGGL